VSEANGSTVLFLDGLISERVHDLERSTANHVIERSSGPCSWTADGGLISSNRPALYDEIPMRITLFCQNTKMNTHNSWSAKLLLEETDIEKL